MKVPITIFGFTAMFMIAMAGNSRNAHREPRAVTVQGCLATSQGSLLLKEGSLGRAYYLRGDVQSLQQRIGKEIKAQGEEQSSGYGESSLDVRRWKQLGDCKVSPNSPAQPEAQSSLPQATR
jgi:hypothetical protein